MESTAQARYIRLSPRKIDQVLMLVRGKSVANALFTLRLLAKRSRPVVEKTIESAFANAGKSNDPTKWYIAQAWVGSAPTMKRMRAHAMGRGSTIRHRSAHLTVILTDQKKKRKGN